MVCIGVFALCITIRWLYLKEDVRNPCCPCLEGKDYIIIEMLIHHQVILIDDMV